MLGGAGCHFRDTFVGSLGGQTPSPGAKSVFNRQSSGSQFGFARPQACHGLEIFLGFLEVNLSNGFFPTCRLVTCHVAAWHLTTWHLATWNLATWRLATCGESLWRDAVATIHVARRCVARTNAARTQARAGPESGIGRGPVLECFGMFWNSFRLEFLILAEIEFGKFWKV